MHLSELISTLPQSLVDALDALGIRTDADLLFSCPSNEIFKKLPTGTISLRDFSTLISDVAELASAPSTLGHEIYGAEAKRREDLYEEDFRTGLPMLDEILGGLIPPRVIEVSGDRGSGKTATSQFVLRHLSRVHESSALWIDTTGDSFSPERMETLLQMYESEDASSVLERLQVALAFDIGTAQEILRSLQDSLASDPTSPPAIRCIVIDTVTPLIGPLLSAVSSQGHATMTTFMHELRALSNKFSLTILVINSSTGAAPRNRDSAFFDTDRKPALGPSFTFMTDTTVWLTKHAAQNDERDSNTVV
ncbi:hypothetical protein CERSUDRAFT_159414, partial [Gelatoporia subvermispora B]